MSSSVRTEIYLPPEFFEIFGTLAREIQQEVINALPVLDAYKWDRTPPLIEDPPNSWHFTYRLPSGWVLRLYVEYDRSSRGVPLKRRAILLGCFPS